MSSNFFVYGAPLDGIPVDQLGREADRAAGEILRALSPLELRLSFEVTTGTLVPGDACACASAHLGTGGFISFDNVEDEGQRSGRVSIGSFRSNNPRHFFLCVCLAVAAARTLKLSTIFDNEAVILGDECEPSPEQIVAATGHYTAEFSEACKVVAAGFYL